MAPSSPPGMVIYAIGDIHGRLDLLDQLHARIAEDLRHRATRRGQVVYLGDYVSRGEDSPGVVNRVREWLPDGCERITLKGNHEDLLLRYLDGELDAGRHWFDYDGLDTLADYGVTVTDRSVRDDASLVDLRRRFTAALPPDHLAFFRSLRIRHRAGGYFFAHGGVRPGVPLDRQADRDCMWIRKAFLDSDEDHGAVVVHGHSISPTPVVRHNRIGIDTGAYRSGVLTCVVLDGTAQAFLQTAGGMPPKVGAGDTVCRNGSR